MKAVIVGGSGLVGRALTRSLSADGHDVSVLSRDAGRHAHDLPSGARVSDWSPGDVARLAASLNGGDVVVNLAGTPVAPWPWTRRRRAAIKDSRVDGARAIVQAIGRLPAGSRPAVLVVVSGIDAYPESEATPDPRPMTESTPIDDSFLAEVSRALEAEAMRAEPLGVRVVRLRMGHVLARDAELVRLLALPVRLFLGGRIGSGSQWMSWIHVDDAVGLFRLSMAEAGPSGVLNLVAPTPCRQADFVRTMARVLHRPARLPVPAWLVRLALGDVSVLLLGSRRVAPARARELGFAFRYTTIGPAIEDVLS